MNQCMFRGVPLPLAGAVKQPRRTSARFVLGCWWIFTIFILSIYTATLAAILTVTNQPGLVDSIEQLAAFDLTPSTLTATNWETLFKTAKNGVHKKIGEQMRDGPKVLTTDEALDYVYSGTGVFMYDISQLDYLYQKDCETLHLAKRVFNANGLGFVLPQKAPYLHAFNRIILKLQEGGFVSMWKRRWWRGSGQCDWGQGTPRVSQSKQLDVASIRDILLLCGVLVLLAAVCLLLSWLHRARLFSAITRWSS